MQRTLYGCETWSLTSRKKCRLRDFENKVLRRIFGDCRRPHKKEPYALYSSLNNTEVIKSRRLRWAGLVALTGESRGAYTVLVGKPKGRRPHGRPRRTWEDNNKMDLGEVGWGARTRSLWLWIGTGGGLL
jgi:hypothetical protein